MRKSILAIAAAGSVFALTAAAASTLSVTGVFDPKAGTGTMTTCDPGETAVATDNDGVKITGFTVTTSEDLSGDTDCTGAYMWVKVPKTNDVAATYYMRIDAKANYTSTPASFTFKDEGAEVVGSIYATRDLTVTAAVGTATLRQPIDGTTLGNASVLVTNTDAAPAAF